MKILITGIAGFIGKHLSKRLLNDRHSIYVIIRKQSVKDKLEQNNIKYFIDNNSAEDFKKYFENEKFDGVIHLASCFIVEHKHEQIDELINSNLLFATRILEAAVKPGVKWFINTGTFWQHYENRVYSPVNLYAATKQAFESVAKYYMETSEIIFVTLKLNDTYGPDDTRPKIFNLWKKAAESGETLDMSPGEQIIDITYIDDVVDAYMRMIELLENDTTKTFKGKSFAVSSGRPVKLKDLAEIFTKVTNKKLNINWGERPYREREVMIPWNKGENVPGWSPKVSLEEGISKLFNFTEIDI